MDDGQDNEESPSIEMQFQETIAEGRRRSQLVAAKPIRVLAFLPFGMFSQILRGGSYTAFDLVADMIVLAVTCVGLHFAETTFPDQNIYLRVAICAGSALLGLVIGWMMAQVTLMAGIVVLACIAALVEKGTNALGKGPMTELPAGPEHPGGPPQP